MKLNVEEISLVNRGEPDRSLVKMDHPHAASMQFALEELLSRDSRRLPDDLPPVHGSRQLRGQSNALNLNTSLLHNQCSTSARSLRVDASLAGPSCGKFCQCQWHIHTKVQIPRWLCGTLGTMFGSYQGTPTLRTRPCNYRKCRRSTKTTSHFTFYFPSRILNAAMTFTSTWKDVTGAGGSWHVSMPQMIPDQHLVWGAHSWSDGEILDLFFARRASPYMVREGDGFSVLLVSLPKARPEAWLWHFPLLTIMIKWAIHHWKIEVCRYLLSQNADRHIPDRKGG